MATVAELEARLETLKAQRDSTVARVSYDGRTVEYRGTTEIARDRRAGEGARGAPGHVARPANPGLHLEGSLSIETWIPGVGRMSGDVIAGF
jgi:hypothetical protein